MHLKSLRLEDFRGFSNLTITDVPASSRLVMLIGPNGTGKSSVFDALLIWSGARGGIGISWDQSFHVEQSGATSTNWNQTIKEVTFHEGEPTSEVGWKKLCYFRSAYRNEVDSQPRKLGCAAGSRPAYISPHNRE